MDKLRFVKQMCRVLTAGGLEMGKLLEEKPPDQRTVADSGTISIMADACSPPEKAAQPVPPIPQSGELHRHSETACKFIQFRLSQSLSRVDIELQDLKARPVKN